MKTSLAPGSRVVGDYLAAAGLQRDLDALGFHIIGYGCTTCNGNSGPLADAIARDITENDIAAVAVLSGNRNFAGRIHPLVPASYLASPALVVAYAIAGTVLIDLTRQPLGIGTDGKPVMLADIWPSDAEIASLLSLVSPDSYRKAYRGGALGHASWSEISAPKARNSHGGRTAPSSPRRRSTCRRPSPTTATRIDDMRALAILGDGITTDTLSPNGAILDGTPAARFLAARGVAPDDFGNYAARRGSHEIAVRGMFANPHIENEMLPASAARRRC